MAKRFTRAARRRKQTQENKIPRWQKYLIAIFVTSMLGMLAIDHYVRAGDSPIAVSRLELAGGMKLTPQERIRLATDRYLMDHGIHLEWIEENVSRRVVRVPKEVQPIEIYQGLARKVEQYGGDVLAGNEDLRSGEMTLLYEVGDSVTIRLVPDESLSRFAGKIAIIIDDFGYSDSPVVSGFLDLPFEITYSVIPGLSFSNSIAKRLADANKSIMIHMPMEALERRVENNGFELMVSMSETEIRERIRRAVSAIPFAEGMNNHMGSRATVDGRLLQAALSELKESGLYFVDSKTNSQTKAYQVAQQIGLLSAQNDFFLDNVENASYIRSRLWNLADLAAEQGAAIAIGHVYEPTLSALKEIVPQLRARGFALVPVSEVLAEYSQPPSNLASGAD